MKQKHRIGGYLVLGVIILIFLAFYYLFPEVKNLASPTFVREYLLGFGILSYPLFIILLALTVPLPLPSTPIVLGGGYLYGTLLGSSLALISFIVGGTISFCLVRKYGRPLLEKLVDKHHIKHFNHLFKRRGIIIAFISYALPIFPSDSICLVLGMSQIKYKTFFLVTLAGLIPRLLIVNSLGEDLYQGFTWKTLILIILAIILVLTALFRERIKKFFFKELKEIEKEAEKVEEEIGLKKIKQR